jgi:type VI secretion system protein ImpH
MADAIGPTGEHLSWLEELAREPRAFDFHVVLRRIESLSRGAPRLGEALRPSEEPVRIGQAPSLSFEPTAVTDFAPAEGSSPGRLGVSFFGMWGPNGPLPVHLTEYARDRARQIGDRTLIRFVDVFHHRMLLLFHRAWAQTQPAAMLDRPEADRFGAYLGSLFGLGFEGTRDRDAFPDRAKLYYAGRFAAATRGAEGLREVIADYFGISTQIEEFVGEWLPLSNDSRWHLGLPGSSVLARTAIVGGRVWSRTDRFRIVLGPLTRMEFGRLLPGAEDMVVLTALVRLYTNDEWGWDVRLTLGSADAEPMCLARGARLGWTSRIGEGIRDDLVFDPMSRRTRRVRPMRPAD